MKAKLAKNDPVLITQLHLTDGSLFEMASPVGFVCLWMDLEHHSYSDETAANLMRAERVGTSDIVARPAKGEFMRMSRLLGASEYIETANKETFIIAQLEEPSALDEAEAMCSFEGIDGLMLGPAASETIAVAATNTGKLNFIYLSKYSTEHEDNKLFESMDKAPSDPIMGITELYNKDTRADKINLSMGVFKDEQGSTPLLDSVKKAEAIIYAEEDTKAYSAIEGFAEFNDAVLPLIFGADHEAVTSGRAATIHTPGGSGALRVVGDFLNKLSSSKTIWVSDPTWVNHINIFETAGLEVKLYPYFDKASNGLAFEAMMTALADIPSADAVLFHGCCHNPTGVDPSNEQWQLIADLVHGNGLLPVLDFAYQGFAEGIREDGEGPLKLVRPGKETLVCGSFSKNFALYNERTGSLTAVATDAAAVDIATSQIKSVIRSIYSSPPAHGGIIVSTILNDPELRAQWEGELKKMRDRIQAMRQLLADTLTAKGVPGDHSFITKQRGMFSFSGLSPKQVEQLKNEHAVYIVGNGRINVAAITPSNCDALCEAISKVN
jgi:aromatic-amino-acid transaminase